MVKRLDEMPEVEAVHLPRIECPTYEDHAAFDRQASVSG